MTRYGIRIPAEVGDIELPKIEINDLVLRETHSSRNRDQSDDNEYEFYVEFEADNNTEALNEGRERAYKRAQRAAQALTFLTNHSVRTGIPNRPYPLDHSVRRVGGGTTLIFRDEWVDRHRLVEKRAVSRIGVYAAPETTHGVVDGRFY